MARFLKVIVNTILIVAIVVAGGLLIPPFAGVTTVIIDDIDMNTNLKEGSVTYAIDKSAAELQVGDKVLMYEGDAQNVYCISAINGSTYTLDDQLSTDGGIQQMQLQGTANKVLFTVPFIGYVSMALRSTEGLIIVGLSVVFVIILFILAEIWKKDEEDEELESEDEEENENSEQDTEVSMSRRQQKKAEKQARKEAKLEKKQAKKKGKNQMTSEAVAQLSIPKAPNATVNHEEEVIKEPEVQEPVLQQAEESTEEYTQISREDQKLFEETSDFFAADIAQMMGIDPEDAAVSQPEALEEKEAELFVEIEKEAPAEEKEKRLAMPAYTKDELLDKAKAAGDEPEIIEDEFGGITFLDYSDIL